MQRRGVRVPVFLYIGYLFFLLVETGVSFSMQRFAARCYSESTHCIIRALTANRNSPGVQTLTKSTARLGNFQLRSTASFNPEVLMSVPEDRSVPAHYSAYERWVRRLYMTNMFHPVKLGLENIQSLYKLLGSPLDDVVVIHIAGTNGKGSVALKCAKTLEFANPEHKVGLFCSPHVSTFRERMQVNGNFITEDEVVSYLPEIYGLCQEHDIPATFFEITTALAFRYYQAHNVDAVVLETGLGGRLDATNVLKEPALAVITSIGLEHTRILGDTIEKIALEKGGIIKMSRPVLVGPNAPDAVLRQCAKEKESGEYYTVPDVLGDDVFENLSEEDLLDYDLENSRIANAALKIVQESFPGRIGNLTDSVVAEGLSWRPPCRFERVQCNGGLTTILDVAHNPSAMDYMVRKLKTSYPEASVRVVVGMSSDKDLKLCGASIREAVQGDVSRIHLVQAAHPRAAKLEDILETTQMHDANFNLEDPSPARQIRAAMNLASTRNEILVVCGSVFLMAEAREALGFDEPRDSDYIAEVAGSGVRHAQENFGNTSVPGFSK